MNCINDLNSKEMLNIQAMTISDLDLIKDILASDFDDFWNYNVFRTELLNENSKYIVLKKTVQEIDGKNSSQIIGFGGIWISTPEAHITNIVVKKCYRNQGFGKVLLEALLNLFDSLNLKSITLEVNEGNHRAIKLYEKFGFNNLGVRKNYYNNSRDAIIMTKYRLPY